MFKRPSMHYGRTPEPVTPYQRAAQVWDERIGSARVQARNWRLMAFGCLLLSGGFSAALVWQSTKGTVSPWVVEVDRFGQAHAVAPARAHDVDRQRDQQQAEQRRIGERNRIEAHRSCPRMCSALDTLNSPGASRRAARICKKSS